MEIIAVILTIIGALAVSFLVDAGLVWLVVWGLTKIGITTICGWTVAFSWPLVLVVYVITIILQNIFRAPANND